MATLQEIYNVTVDLLDKRDGAGSLDDTRTSQVKAKFPMLAVPVMLELAELNNIHIDDPYIDGFDYAVELPDFSALSVMPYGIAAEIARQGGDADSWSAHKSNYESMKRKIRLPMQETEDVEMLLGGLSGRF